VGEEQMLTILEKTREELLHRESMVNEVDWTQQQLKKSLPYLKENFLNDLINNNLTSDEILKHSNFYKIAISDYSGMIVIRTLEKYNNDKVFKEQDRLLSVQNMVKKLLQDQTPSEANIIFVDGKGNLVIIVPIIKLFDWVMLGRKIRQACNDILNQPVILDQDIIKNGIMDIPKIYQKLIGNIGRNSKFTPVVRVAKEYIDNHYNEDISLERVADEIPVSPTYLSRLLKQEIGVSFIEYLTQVRIQKAIQLMNDPAVKIYEIAECVGYSSQHYFCNVFKKVLNMSPEEYRKGGIKH
jgi:two-component system response regulator YesN